MDYQQMIWRLSLCAMLSLGASCTAHRPPAPGDVTGTSLDEVYAHARQQGSEAGEQTLREDLQMQGTLGYLRPYVPVRTPPNVIRVWIPPFEDEQHNLVQGHWVHVVVHTEGWYTGQQASPIAATLPHAAPTPSATVRPAATGGRP